MRTGAILLLCLMVLTLGAAFGLAQEHRQAAPAPTETEISLDNQLFFRIRTPAAGYTVLEREKTIYQRLVVILSCHRPGPVTISPIRGKPTIYVDGLQLVTVYPQDAAANPGASMMQLAQIWAANLRTGLPQVMPGALPTGPARPECVCPTAP
jgi:hypothetical protein